MCGWVKSIRAKLLLKNQRKKMHDYKAPVYILNPEIQDVLGVFVLFLFLYWRNEKRPSQTIKADHWKYSCSLYGLWKTWMFWWIFICRPLVLLIKSRIRDNKDWCRFLLFLERGEKKRKEKYKWNCNPITPFNNQAVSENTWWNYVNSMYFVPFWYLGLDSMACLDILKENPD